MAIFLLTFERFVNSKWWLALAGLTVSAANNAQTPSQYDDVQQSVIGFFDRASGGPSSCNVLKEAAAKSKDKQTTAMMIAFCDSDFDFTKPVTFSGVSRKEVEGQSYVCGIISGVTLYGRKMGARFIVAEPYHLVIGYKFSKRPIAYFTNDNFLIDDYRSQVNTFNRVNNKICR